MANEKDEPRRPTVDVATRLNAAAIRLLRRISREDGDDGLTGARASALSVLCYRGAMTASELARRERVSAPTITRTVDALVRDGLVQRTVSGADRRAVQLEATIDGRRLMERGRLRRVQSLAAELARLTGAELSTLSEAVTLLERIEREEEP